MISAKMVKELRELTGAGMMDCKKALTETDGDMEKAVDFLREKGLAAAAKKSSRIAAEGIVAEAMAEDAKSGVLVEINCETDFVAKNEDFKSFANDVAKQALVSEAADLEAFLGEAWLADTTKTVKDMVTAQVAVIGENINIRRFEKLNAADGCVACYIHGGGSLGVMVYGKTDVVNDEIKTCLRNVAMQVAAMSPLYLDAASVPAEVLEHEKSILIAQMKEDPKMANKPEQVLAKIVDGKIGKYYKENCLVEQAFVKDGDINVATYVANCAKKLGAEIKLVGFTRFAKGEGIEKKEENFAAEIASMIK